MKNTEQVHARIQSFLDDVAAHIKGMPEAERHDLLKQLESHIYEALQAKMGVKEADVRNVEAVLAEMDLPESYGAVGKTSLLGLRRGQWALAASLGSLALAGVVMALLGVRAGTVFFLAGEVAAFVLGILSWREPFGKAAVLTSGILILAAILVCA